MWHYDKQKRLDKKGNRWHFVHHDWDGLKIPYNEQPDEYYFRDDARTVFGVLRFGRRKDNSFRSYEVMINKIMNDEAFRKTLIAPETKGVWKKNWK